ncbi:uncharacterized protein TNCV_4617701 [Trichonephila clavipes]|nr:uncharacterized protein TNCV_4617701 [Trichonephila clavipes]
MSLRIGDLTVLNVLIWKAFVQSYIEKTVSSLIFAHQCSVIGDVTGKVIDVAVLSSYCKGCEKWRGPKSGHSYEEWKLKHQPHCVKNHIGSSSKMEVDGMKEIFQRSVPQRNAKYIKYIGDGDTKTFPEFQRTVPYSIEKVECVGHIQKRMGARLRKLKTMNRGKKLSDVYLQVDDHVHPGKCPAAVSSEKKQDLLHMEFYHHLSSWAMNEQMSYFSSFSDEWSRDLKSVQVQKQRSCRGGRGKRERELLEVITAEMLETEQQQKLEQQEQLSIEKLRLEMELSRNANQSAT